MATVTASTLSWLTPPSTGNSLFTKPPAAPPPPLTHIHPLRRLTTRNTELFLARGNEVRIADLPDLKARHPKFKATSNLGYREHKTLHLPAEAVDFEIVGMEVSGDGLWMVVWGVHEVVVLVLPGEGAAKRGEKAVIVPHWRRVARSTLNEEKGGKVVRCLWHPAGVEGAGLCVLTSDGYLRTYAFTLGQELSFELADQEMDFYALTGKKRHTGGFAADDDDMVPASMCFASGERDWSVFTLYMLMRGGDVYALTPLVPSRWMASRDYLQSLSLDITAQLEEIDSDTTAEQRSAIRQQTKWINEVLNQESNIDEPAFGKVAQTCFLRPETVGPVPMLQGPFLFQPPPPELAYDVDYAACDILHVDADPAGVLAVVYSHGKVDICLEFEPLSAKWTDRKKGFVKQATLPVIASYETIDLQLQPEVDSENVSWPVFVRDPQSEALWFVAHNKGVTAFSMEPWIGRLEDTDVLEGRRATKVQKIVESTPTPVDGCIVVYAAYVGYILLASHTTGVASVEFDEPAGPQEDSFTLQASVHTTPAPGARLHTRTPSIAPPSARSVTPTPAVPPPPGPLPALHPPFEIPRVFTAPSALRQIPTTNTPILFSPATSAALRTARDTLKEEYTTLMSAAQSTHDRAAAQRIEYQQQLKLLSTLHTRLQTLQNAQLAARLTAFLTKQEELAKRADEVLRQVIIGSEQGISDAERKWFGEVEKVGERLEGYRRRKEEVGRLVDELMGVREGRGERRDEVPPEVREGCLKGLEKLLERETRLVERTRRRLEGLEVEVAKIG